MEIVRLARAGELRGRTGNYLLAELEVVPAGVSRQQCYLLPFAVAWGEENLAPGAPLLPYTLAKVRRGPKVGALYDATHADDFARTLLRLMHAEHHFATGDFDSALPVHRRRTLRLRASRTRRRSAGSVRRRATARWWSTSGVLLKIYRRLEPGIHPELEIGRFLTEVAGFAHTPPLLGSIEDVAADGTPDRARRRLRLRCQPGQRLAVHPRSPRPGARGGAPHPGSQPAAGRGHCTISISPWPS